MVPEEDVVAVDQLIIGVKVLTDELRLLAQHRKRLAARPLHARDAVMAEAAVLDAWPDSLLQETDVRFETTHQLSKRYSCNRVGK